MPGAVDHYADEYWNDLPRVVAYLCERSTGDPSLWWMDHFKRTYAQAPFKRALSFGCGNGWVEREFIDRQIALHFEAFDASPDYLRAAEQARGSRSISYTRASFDDYVPGGTFDLIVNVASLHHVRYLYRMVHLLASALEPDGLFVHWEYVGPSRNQYSDAHLAVLSAVNQALPARLRTPHRLRQDLANFLNGDPTEAVHASEIRSALADEFDTVEHKVLGGGIAYPILWNNLAEFRKDDAGAREALEWLLRLDASLTDARVVPPLFAYIVCRRKQEPAARGKIARLLEPAREKFADRNGGKYPVEMLRELTREGWAKRLAGVVSRIRRS